MSGAKLDFEPILADAMAHAAEQAPAESCGLVVVFKGRLRYIPARNIAAEPRQTFEIDPEDYVRAEEQGELVAVVHSHPYQSVAPSPADLTMIERTQLPWIIVNPANQAHSITEPSGYRAPLIGRPYTHGVLDCYQIVVDHFREVLGIELPHFERRDGWWERGQNLYLENFEKAGFVCIGGSEFDLGQLREHDCFLMQVASPVPNHAAVYVGDNQILHHVPNRLSSRDLFGGYWRRVMTHVVRHRELMA